jgi:hypothetical protein
MFARGASRLSFFTSRRIIRQYVQDIHPSQNPWIKSKETTMSYPPQFTPIDIEIAEEMLTEILYLAITCQPNLKGAWTAFAEGISEILSDEAIARSKDYAQYRARQASN